MSTFLLGFAFCYLLVALGWFAANVRDDPIDMDDAPAEIATLAIACLLWPGFLLCERREPEE